MSLSPELEAAYETYPNLRYEMNCRIQGALAEGYGENEGEAFEAEDLLDLAVSPYFPITTGMLLIAKHLVSDYGFNIA